MFEKGSVGNNDAFGLICGNKHDVNTVLPNKYLPFIDGWNQSLFSILSKHDIVPKGRFKEMLTNYDGRGYQYIFAVMGVVHPKLLETPAKAFPCHPEQRSSESFQSYTRRFEFFRHMEALICDRINDLSMSHTQDSFILKSLYSEKLLDLVKEE